MNCKWILKALTFSLRFICTNAKEKRQVAFQIHPTIYWETTIFLKTPLPIYLEVKLYCAKYLKRAKYLLRKSDRFIFPSRLDIALANNNLEKVRFNLGIWKISYFNFIWMNFYPIFKHLIEIKKSFINIIKPPSLKTVIIWMLSYSNEWSYLK